MTLLNVSRGMQQGQDVQGGERHQDDAQHYVNVGDSERWASAIAGGAIVAAGLKSRSALGLVGAALGGALIYRGLSGHCYGYAALSVEAQESDQASLLHWMRNMIRLRKQNYDPLLPSIDAQFRELDAQVRLRMEQRNHLQQRLQYGPGRAHRGLLVPDLYITPDEEVEQFAVRPDFAQIQRKPAL